MKKSLAVSSVLLTLLGLAATLLAVLSLAAYVTSGGLAMLFTLFIAACLWWLIALLAGVLGLFSLKWPKLRTAAIVLSLLFAVRSAVDVVSCFSYWETTTFLGCLLRLALVVWFFLSTLKAPD